jgi:hypothetical protein
LRRVGVILAVAALGAGAGFGAVAVFNGGSGPHRRPLTPSVAEFRFPTRAPVRAAAAGDIPAATFVEPASARAAVEAFLAAERAVDAGTAFALLAADDRDDVGSSAAWAAARSDRPRPTAFELGGERAAADGVDVPVAVTREPSLDPFAGFVSARANQVWRAVHENGRWRVRAEPVADEFVLPPASAAEAPAAEWANALAACDRAGARRLQGGDGVTGSADLLAAPCREHGAWTAGSPVTFERAPDVQSLLEAYGPDTGGWARLVPVHGPHSHFFAAVAPLGDAWRVIGVASDGG